MKLNNTHTSGSSLTAPERVPPSHARPCTLVWPRSASVILLLFCWLASSPLEANDVVLVRHKTTTLPVLDKQDVKDLFLGKKTLFAETLVSVATLKDGDIHKQFLRDYVGKTVVQYRNYWRIQLFSGKGMMPPVFKNETDLVAFIRRTPGAIGVVSTTTFDEHKNDIAEVKVR